MEYCKTCKYYPESEQAPEDIKEFGGVMRVCTNHEIGDGKIEIQGYGEIRLCVAPDFGCVLHEEKH